MKLFDFLFRKFEEEPTVISDAIETWVVKWRYVSSNGFCGDVRTGIKHQAFMSRESAEKYSKELQDARKLLGDAMGDAMYIHVQKQSAPTNA